MRMSQCYVVEDMYVDAQMDTNIAKKVADIAKEKSAQSNKTDIFYIDLNNLKFAAIYYFDGYVIKPITKSNENFVRKELEETVYEMDSNRQHTVCQTIFVGCNFKFCIPRIKWKTFLYCAFIDCNFNSVVLENIEFLFTKFDGCNFYGADIRRSTFDSESSVRRLRKNNESVHVLQRCPTEGSFIGYKLVVFNANVDGETVLKSAIAKLLIPADAKRSSTTGLECRCSKAEVLDIITTEGERMQEARSMWDSDFVYKVGEIVYSDSFNDNRFEICTSGIHFFMHPMDIIITFNGEEVRADFRDVLDKFDRGGWEAMAE